MHQRGAGAGQAEREDRLLVAVGAGREEVARLAAQIDRGVHIANDNCPHQVVVVVEPKDAETVITLPVHQHLTQEEMNYMIDCVHSFYSGWKMQEAENIVVHTKA